MVKLHKKVESRALFDFVQALTRAVGDANGGGKNMSQAENVARVYVQLSFSVAWREELMT